MDGITTKINGNIKLKEPAGGIRFGTDALLLAYFALPYIKRGLCIDIGTGSGVLPLLLLSAGCPADFAGIEIQKEYAAAAKENVETNGFAERFKVVCADVSDLKSVYIPGSASYVITNPPYMRFDCGKDNENKSMSVARREVFGGAYSFCKAASRFLKSGGKFFAVYRPDRLANMLCSMRDNSIEPKRIRLVFANGDKKPTLALIQGIKDAAEGLVFEKNFYIYNDQSNNEHSEEMKKVYRFFG